jgi:flagellar biosynthesis chaperone FliJ
MTMIKTWRERCEEHPDHEGIVSEQMIRCRMQEEIDELRQAIEQAEDAVAAEREACAKVCDDWPEGREDVYSIAQAIRARGEQ